jgi:hypothetical protein
MKLPTVQLSLFSSGSIKSWKMFYEIATIRFSKRLCSIESFLSLYRIFVFVAIPERKEVELQCSNRKNRKDKDRRK